MVPPGKPSPFAPEPSPDCHKLGSTALQLPCTHDETDWLPPPGPPKPPPDTITKRTCLSAAICANLSGVTAGSVPMKPAIASTGLPLSSASDEACCAFVTATR